MVSGEINARLLALQNTYLDHLTDTKNTLMQSILWVSQRDLTVEEKQTLKRVSHNLAGSAQTYGFVKIGEAARLLEACIEETDFDQGKLQILAAISRLYEEIVSAGNVQAVNTPAASVEEKNIKLVPNTPLVVHPPLKAI